MSEHREFDGADLEAALSRASESLRIAREELDYEVLQQGRRGFLGVGSRGVRIRIRLPDSLSPAVGTPAEGEPPSAQVEVEPASPEASRLTEFLDRLLADSPFDLEFQIHEDSEKIRIDLDGADRDLFLERRGEGLGALQVLLGRVAAQSGSAKPIYVDCAHFRRDREDELVEIALLLAEKVKKLGEPQSLSPMNPYERRLVHLALREDPGVETRSDGEGFIKRVVIYPRKS